jgi:hypothetical protein
MISTLKKVLERAQAWPAAYQAELAEYAHQIECRHGSKYQASAEELQAVDDADRSGVASQTRGRGSVQNVPPRVEQGSFRPCIVSPV